MHSVRKAIRRIGAVAMIGALLMALTLQAVNAEETVASDDTSAAAAGAASADSQIVAPSDATARAAFEMLDKHCARCHQEGRLKRERPAKNFGNVLKLEEIARDPNLVRPGNPDASRIYNQILKREMPYDAFYEYSAAEPTPEEIATLRDWIVSLGSSAQAACSDRQPIDNASIVREIAEDIDTEQPHRVEGLRYVTLTNIYNGCAGEEELAVYRQGVVKLLNSLSRNSDPLRLQTIDEARTIIKFHLDDLGWAPSHWELILANYPYAALPDVPQFRFIAGATHTELPFVRGDFLAFAASRPPLYHDLLGLPKTFGELQKRLGLDVTQNIERYLAKRAGFQVSGVSRNNRLIERHTIETGVFWTSYDFSESAGRKNLFEHPLGPGGKNGFEPDGGETIFSLPNGFNAYYLNEASGARIDQGPTSIVQDTTQRDLAVTNGISCMGCHDQGFRKAKDEIRKHVAGDRSFKRAVREAVEALYPPVEEMDALLAADTERFREALRKAGLDPDLKLNGVETINALSKHYEKDVSLEHAAIELGLDAEELVKRLKGADGEVFRLGRRLEQGVVPRDAFQAGFPELLAHVTDDGFAQVALKGAKEFKVATAAAVTRLDDATASATQATYISRDFELSLISDKTVYKVGELATFTVRSGHDCHLTLINVAPNGEGTVIFPNDYQRDNFLKAGTELQVPGEKAGFQLRLQDKGEETVVAVCNATGKSAHGIEHDFSKQQFTALGDYNAYITRAIKVEANAKKTTERKKADTKTKKERSRYEPRIAPGDLVARTAIRITVQ